MDVTTGYLLISDISGYTKFLVESELGHAKEILDTLLKTTTDAVKAPVRVLKPMGDAIMSFVPTDEFVQPQSLLESIREIYFEFRRHLDFMTLNTTCECDACVNMASLDMKVFLHFGEFIEQNVGGIAELQGRDVILTSLLMKNGVTAATGLAGYALITDAAIEAMDAAELTSAMTPHGEAYEHFDEVHMRIWDLPSEWEAARAKARSVVTTESAWIVEARETSAPQWRAWDVATDKDMKRIYYDMQSVERTDDLGGPVREGSQYHCVHEMGDVRFTITDWNPPHSFESDEVAFGIPVHFTMQVEGTADGSILRIMYSEPEEGDPTELEPLFRGAA
jgi:hypothetical protein